MIQIPVLVVLKGGRKYLDDYRSVRKYVSEAIAPYNSSITSQEYEWMGRDEFRRHIITAMWGEFNPVIQGLMDRSFSADGEVMEKLIRLFDPSARWDASSGMILSRRSPDGFWERWEIGGSQRNYIFHTMDIDKRSRKLPIASIDEIEPGRILSMFNFNFHTIVVYDGYSSQLYRRMVVVQGVPFVETKGEKEWKQEVSEVILNLQSDDVLVGIDCSITSISDRIKNLSAHDYLEELDSNHLDELPGSSI